MRSHERGGAIIVTEGLSRRFGDVGAPHLVSQITGLFYFNELIARL